MKIVVSITLLGAFAGCLQSEPHYVETKNTDSSKINESELKRRDMKKREWYVGDYITNDTYRMKALTDLRYTTSKVENSTYMNFSIMADDSGFSFKIQPSKRVANQKHLGGYKITAKNEDGDQVSFYNRVPGHAIILRDRDRDTYEKYHNFFKDNDTVKIKVQDGYVSRYYGTLDTKFY